MTMNETSWDEVEAADADILGSDGWESTIDLPKGYWEREHEDGKLGRLAGIFEGAGESILRKKDVDDEPDKTVNTWLVRRDAGTIVKIYGSANLDRQLALGPIGCPVRIEYEGIEKLANGRSMKKFKVSWKRSKVEA